MKFPRDVSGKDLINSPKTFGYEQTRHTGSHVRLTTLENGEHHVTVPLHTPIKLGTLSGILGEVARHFELTRDDVVKELFG